MRTLPKISSVGCGQRVSEHKAELVFLVRLAKCSFRLSGVKAKCRNEGGMSAKPV